MSRMLGLFSPLLTLQCVAVLVLVGCGVSSTEDLKAWLDTERTLLGADTSSFAAPRAFVPEAYALADQVDPFASSRLNGIEAPATDTLDSPLKPAGLALEFTGQKQDLENFPLESLQFRGTLAQDGVRVALVWAGDRLHQVRPGAYLGTRKGKVLEISPTAIVLRELEQDASGQWKPKNTVLPVREGDK